MALLDSNVALITHPNPRLIGTIIPDIVVEEICHDQLQITEFPVESGAPISDHAYKRPPEVIMRCGFSNSTAQTEGYVQEVYVLLLNLQDSLQPFNVTTGKRQYQQYACFIASGYDGPAKRICAKCYRRTEDGYYYQHIRRRGNI